MHQAGDSLDLEARPTFAMKMLLKTTLLFAPSATWIGRARAVRVVDRVVDDEVVVGRLGAVTLEQREAAARAS